MKKLLVGLSLMFVGVASATTINLDWIVDGNTYAQTTCESGGNLNIPSTTPTKRGYHFIGWDFYTQLEYIESTGTQYIDTELVAPNGFRLKTDFSISANNLVEMELAGAEKQGVPSSRNWIGIKKYAMGVGSGYASLKTGFTEQTWYSLDASTDPQNVFYKINGADYGITWGAVATASNDDTPLLLFALPTSTGGTNYTYVKLKKTQFFVNNSLVRNFIPARRNSDNVVGMYDTVSQTFFTNAGTGDFIAGPVSANQTLE